MLEIYLTRHGQDEDNKNKIINGRRDKPLTRLGRIQAGMLLRKIRALGIKLDCIYTSPLARALKTAKIIDVGLGLGQPISLDLLVERDYGILTGKFIWEIPQLCSDLLITKKITYFLTPENGETFSQLMSRAEALLELLREKHSNGKVLLVTHSDTGKMIFGAYYKLDWRDVLKMFHFGNAEILYLSPKTEPEGAHIVKFRQRNV
jgi:broad specificity phosphatase PhoE